MGFSAMNELKKNIVDFEKHTGLLEEKKSKRNGNAPYTKSMFGDDLEKASIDGIVRGMSIAIKHIEKEFIESAMLKNGSLKREDEESMTKKPFAIRVEPSVSTRFRALSIVLSKDGAPLLAEMIGKREMELSTDERNAYEMLLKLWESQEEAKNKDDE